MSDQLDEDARRLWSNLCEGDGEHSEALDVAIIKAAFQAQLAATHAAWEKLATLFKVRNDPEFIVGYCEGLWDNSEKAQAQLAATHAAIRALRDEFAHSALVAGQYSVEGPADESKIAANAQADTFSVCAHQMLRLLGDEQEERGIEVCLGCGKPTATSDCGCPAGTGVRRTTNPEPAARLLGEEKP